MSGADLPQDKVPKDQLLAIVRAASGVQVVWDTDERPHLGQEPSEEWAWLEIGATGSKDIGVDEQRAQPNTATVPPTQSAIVVGRRRCTVNLMAYSLDRGIDAADLCGRVRFGFHRQAVRDLMAPTLALIRFERIVRLPQYTRDGRVCLRANMDVQMAYVVAADVGDSAASGYILSVGSANGTLTT